MPAARPPGGRRNRPTHMSDAATMADTAETTAPAEATQQPPAEAQPAAEESRKVKPVDAARREAAAKKQSVRRRLDKFKAAKDLDELERLIDAERGKNPPEQPTAQPAPAQAPPAAEGAKSGAAQQAAAQQQHAGWPSAAQIAAFQPMALQIWGGIAGALSGTRYQIDQPRRVQVGPGEFVDVPPVPMLADATAPVLAKYLPAEAVSPEVALLLAVGIVFLPPATAHLVELVRERKAAGGGVQTK